MSKASNLGGCEEGCPPPEDFDIFGGNAILFGAFSYAAEQSLSL